MPVGCDPPERGATASWADPKRPGHTLRAWRRAATGASHSRSCDPPRSRETPPQFGNRWLPVVALSHTGESTATADCIAMNVSWRRRMLLLALATLGLLAAACGGLNASEWRRELEPLLPEGFEIVETRTGNCTVNPNCSVGFVLEHDRSRYAEDVATFESTMVAEDWTRIGGGQDNDTARMSFERKGISVSVKLLSPSWRERCIESRGTDDGNCQSTLLVKN